MRIVLKAGVQWGLGVGHRQLLGDGQAQGWFLPPRHFISFDKTRSPKVAVFYERLYGMQYGT